MQVKLSREVKGVNVKGLRRQRVEDCWESESCNVQYAQEIYKMKTKINIKYFLIIASIILSLFINSLFSPSLHLFL